MIQVLLHPLHILFVPDDIPEEVDWANLTILPDEEGFANAAVDEDMVYEAMRFNSADERA